MDCQEGCGAGTNHDDDCYECTINNNNLNISEDYSNIYLNEKLIKIIAKFKKDDKLRIELK